MKIIKSIPAENLYFKEQSIEVGNAPSTAETAIVNVYDECEYQSVIGFGGAFTESAAYNYSLLSDEQKKAFMEGYFSKENGIGYNFGRTHINSCDFSLDLYTYIEDGDTELATFNIERDRKYIIPFIKDALQYCEGDIMLFASPWSPPAFMKDTGKAFRGGKLLDEYKPVWAKYYARYIKAMAEEGIAISAISVQNEPMAKTPWESCNYSGEEEGEFVEKYLAPALDEAGLSDIKIIIWDHNKERVYDRAKATFTYKDAEKRVWGIGHHWYTGDHYDALRLTHEKFGKVLISSEICGPINQDAHAVAELYGKEICGDFNNFTAAFCDWNLLLSKQGGPFHNRSDKTAFRAGAILEDRNKGCYAPVLFDHQTKELIFTPIFYYIGHFSKFVQKGAKRIASTKYCQSLHTCAFKNPDGSIVLVVMNTDDDALPVIIRHQDVCTKTTLEPHAIMSVIL